jgi:hypothetical protein
MGALARRLLDRYVQMEAFALSQLLVKSVETRDWLQCAEPRSVRAVAKRVLEVSRPSCDSHILTDSRVQDVTAIDWRVGQMYADASGGGTSGSRTGSGSTRRTMPRAPTAQLGGGAGGSTGAIDSALGRLWTERVDYFASVAPHRASIVHGCIKLCLKSLLECVRMMTFGVNGFQQMQVRALGKWCRGTTGGTGGLPLHVHALGALRQCRCW